MGLLSDWREWASTYLTPGGKIGGSLASENRVYGGKSVTRGGLHPHKMQSIPPLKSHWKNLVKPRIIICSIIIFSAFENNRMPLVLQGSRKFAQRKICIYEIGPQGGGVNLRVQLSKLLVT